MREVRVSAGGVLDCGDKLEVTVDILWVTGLCHARIHKLMFADFRYHHIVPISLNIYLFEHHVPLTVYKRLLKRMDVLEKTVNTFPIKLQAVARKQKLNHGQGVNLLV